MAFKQPEDRHSVYLIIQKGYLRKPFILSYTSSIGTQLTWNQLQEMKMQNQITDKEC